MILTITTTATTGPATDLGFLLHKHPERLQSFDVTTGTAHVFYPEATPERCTAALLLEVDPIRLVRGRKGPSSEGFALGQFVNDRPYAASSMLSTAMTKVFKTAMTGRCDSRPELAASPLPLEDSRPVATRPGRSGPGPPALRADGLDHRRRPGRSRRDPAGLGRLPLRRSHPHR